MTEDQPKKRTFRRFRKLLRIVSYFVVALFAFLIGVGVGLSDTPTDQQDSPATPVATVAASGEERAAQQENELPAFRPEPEKATSELEPTELQPAPEAAGEGVALEPTTPSESEPHPTEPKSSATDRVITTSSGEEITLREYQPEDRAMGHLAGQITREREAVERFRPAGVWVVRQDERQNAPTVGYFWIFEDGSATLYNPNCGLIGHGRWRYEPRYMQLTVIEPDGTQATSMVLGVPWRSRVAADGHQTYTGGYVWLDSGKTWMFLNGDTSSECE